MPQEVLVRQAASHLSGVVPYDPKYLPARIYLNANESPYGLPASVVDELAQSIDSLSLHRYPDPLAKELRSALALEARLGTGQVLIGNGGDELLFDLLLAYGGLGRKLLIAPPSFSSYELDAQLTNTTLVEVPRLATVTAQDAVRGLSLDEEACIGRLSQGDIDIVMIASPNNPTGDALDEGSVRRILESSNALVVLDQAYVDFASPVFDMRKLLASYDNLAILRTFSKAYALAGLRLGYLLAAECVIQELIKTRQPYSVNTLSARAGVAALKASGELQVRVDEARQERARVAEALRSMPGVTTFPSEANFILFTIEGAHTVWEQLYERYGILLRDLSLAPDLTDCLRVSMGTPQENNDFLEALSALLGERE